MSVAICRGPDGRQPEHCPLVLEAGGTTEIHTGELTNPVIAEQDGTGYHLTNRYPDGIVGVTRLDREDADVDESPLCIGCGCEIHHWDHTKEGERMSLPVIKFNDEAYESLEGVLTHLKGWVVEITFIDPDHAPAANPFCIERAEDDAVTVSEVRKDGTIWHNSTWAIPYAEITEVTVV